MVLLLSPVAAWALYKPVRIVAPEWNGVSCVNDDICIDDPQRTDEAQRIYASALRFVNEEIGEIDDKPRVVFCATEKCFDAFGFHAPAKAKAIGSFGLVIGPSGWENYLLRHEFIHHLQSERLGAVGQWSSPAWFKEGMAYSLSGDPRELKEPFTGYRKTFDHWYRGVGKQRIWQEAKKL